MSGQISEFASKLKSNPRIAGLKEEATKQAIILPLLQLLGWNPFDVEEVTPEYSVENKRVDYALRLTNRNEVFVEVKNPGEDLESHEEQLLDYSFRQGVEIGVLTNGITWWFYLPVQKGDWKDRKFYTIDILQQDPDDVESKFTALLSKDNVKSGNALKNAKSIFAGKQKKNAVGATLPEAWNKIITEPDSFLVELLAETTEKLCGFKPETDEIVRFIGSNVEQLLLSQEEASPLGPNPLETQLGQSGVTSSHARADRITQEDLVPYIIAVLYEHGGSATKRQVQDEIFRKLKDIFMDAWFQKKLRGNVPRWEKDVAWAKQMAVQRGYVKRPHQSGWGVWELTPAGKEHYHAIKGKPR